MKKILFLSFMILLCATNVALCADMSQDVALPTDSPDFIPVEELLAYEPDDTTCATAVFENALAQKSSNISENASEQDMSNWISQTMQDTDVLRQVMQCPEIANVEEDETITFIPIKYTFPNGREIVINYETQPKILKQRITLGEKQSLPSGDPNPRVDPRDNNAVWTNTDPAWYGIMVVESGTLSDFIGPEKNNTVSLKYIEENIDNIFPKSGQCTGKSALTNDTTMVNLAMKETVNIEGDTNDYYVAGDVNLQWISYLEIGLDVVITVATAGGGADILGATKAARASKSLKTLSTAMRTLRKETAVMDYARLAQKREKAMNELKKISRIKENAKYTEKSKEIENYTKAMDDLAKNDENVKKYKQYSDTFSSLNDYRRSLRSVLKPAQRGNVIAKAWKTVKALNTGGKQLRNAAKVARSSMTSGRVKDWLFQSTLANAGALAKLESAGGLLYGALRFIGDTYDWTETSTGEFTNDIEFKPLTLLSADDLQGQENMINYGMWLMWLGDSYSAADDDAAFLQAMDFANKFHFNLEEIQEQNNNHACNVDIYVVRPIIRNPGTENAELYFLVMNDEPWTTRE